LYFIKLNGLNDDRPHPKAETEVILKVIGKFRNYSCPVKLKSDIFKFGLFFTTLATLAILKLTSSLYSSFVVRYSLLERSVCVCVCVCVSERERERERGREKERERGEREREREREREKGFV
jgi:hypothetical protein